MTKKFNYNCLSYDIKNIIWLKVGEIKAHKKFKKKSFQYINQLNNINNNHICTISLLFYYNKNYNYLKIFNLSYFIKTHIKDNFNNKYNYINYDIIEKEFLISSYDINREKKRLKKRFLKDDRILKNNKEEKIKYINNF